MNQLVLDGTISHMDEIRFTPANIPIRNFKINFEDFTKEKIYKHVGFEINAVLVGDLVKLNFDCNETYRFKGFLDKRSQKSNQLIFHIQDYKTRSLKNG